MLISVGKLIQSFCFEMWLWKGQHRKFYIWSKSQHYLRVWASGKGCANQPCRTWLCLPKLMPIRKRYQDLYLSIMLLLRSIHPGTLLHRWPYSTWTIQYAFFFLAFLNFFRTISIRGFPGPHPFCFFIQSECSRHSILLMVPRPWSSRLFSDLFSVDCQQRERSRSSQITYMSFLTRRHHLQICYITRYLTISFHWCSMIIGTVGPRIEKVT